MNDTENGLAAFYCKPAVKTNNKVYPIWYKIWYASGFNPETPYKSTFSQSIFFMVGNSRTSRMDAESVSSITRRSTPKPRPPVGGII